MKHPDCHRVAAVVALAAAMTLMSCTAHQPTDQPPPPSVKTAPPATGESVRLQPGQEQRRRVQLPAGLHEWQVTGSGSGWLKLQAGDQKRTLRVAAPPSLYGVVFELAQPAEMELVLQFSGEPKEQFDLASANVVPADADRRTAWAAARESFALLGYYGTDPQRPAPGAAPRAATTFSKAELERWAIRETVVFYDASYDSHWIEDDAGVAAFFTRRAVPAKNAVEAEAWLKPRASADKGVGSSIIFVMGSVPTSIVYPPFADCLLAKYLRAGGRVVWLANVPMYVAQGEKGPFIYYGTDAEEQMLGLTTDRQTFYGLNTAPTLTDAGKAWGVTPGLTLARPVHTRSVTVPFVTDPGGDYCGVGLVNLRPDLPLSGFVFVPDAARSSNTNLLSNVYRLARYSGAPAAVPAAAPLPVPNVPVEAKLRFGTNDLRMAFLRGESVPLILRMRALKPGVRELKVRTTLGEDNRLLREEAVTVPVAEQETDQPVGHLELNGLRVGRYQVSATLEAGGQTVSLTRELRIGPAPDHRGNYVAIWCNTSPKQNRTEYLLDDLVAHNLQPMFVDDNLRWGRDLALWYGFSFSSHQHGTPASIPNPPGYDDYRRGSTGQVLRVMSQGDKRESKAYASPYRRQAEADTLVPLIKFDTAFPASRRRTVTVDDYSQYLGLDYNRFAVEGFRARYGVEPPRPPGTEDPYSTIDVPRPPGIIPDDDPWILLNRYWSETYGDVGRRLARAMEDGSGGTGKIGPVPGGMQIPVMNGWSAQYPPYNFGATDGFNLLCFYYYNSYWQPPLAHIWWLECARMGNRELEQWMMPDSYRFEFESFYRNNLWLIHAGGAEGIAHFCYEQRKNAPMRAMKGFGAWSQRYGLLLEQLRPAPKKVAMLVPFENIIYRIAHCFEMAYPFMNLLQAKVDVEPVSPDELDPVSIRRYEAVVLAQTKWLKAGTVRLLEDYIANGGKVVLDSVTADAIPVKGATRLDFPLGEIGIEKYGDISSIARVRAAMQPVSAPVVDCADPLVAVRRAALPDGTPGAWLAHNYTTAEFLELRPAAEFPPDKARALEDKLGYRRDVVTTTITRADDGRVPFDVFGGRVLESARNDGMMTVKVELPKWEGKLILFLRALPAKMDVVGLPSDTRPGLPVQFGVYVYAAHGNLLTTPLPLQLIVRDPKGQASREYARRLLTSDGKAAHEFAFAVNDLRGVWTLELEDVLTGLKATREIRLP